MLSQKQSLLLSLRATDGVSFNYLFAENLILFSGKSTVVSLLERFYDADSGSIKIDGVDLKEFDPAWLRGRLIGFIGQVVINRSYFNMEIIIIIFVVCLLI